MPWPVYSERFILVTLKGTYYGYTVPAGKRVVVNSLFCFGNGIDACFFELDLGSVPIFAVTIPASERSRSIDVRLVAYQGEQLKAIMGHSPGSMTVCGYLLDATSSAAAAAPENDREIAGEYWDHATPLPAA